ncbi:MAG: TetR/AcrR family transcriptional regulator [Actinobacteria bacterium]|nr:TetR/AcrR family transcriptional regulator [Actinomycetota bacterium]
MDVRTMRADAVASVTRILDAARRVFQSGDGNRTLDRIAQEAGVGIATLYRHFPNRQSLAEGVYQRLFAQEIEPLLLQVEAADGSHRSLLALAERIVEITRRERGLVASLGDLGETTVDLLRPHRERFEELVARGHAAGNLRPELAGSDLPRLVAMLASAGLVLDVDEAERRRYLHLLLDGLRPQLG